jgi:hypothetical protein
MFALGIGNHAPCFTLFSTGRERHATADLLQTVGAGGTVRAEQRVIQTD